MSMMPKLQHFAAVCGVVLSTLFSTSVFAAPMHHSVTAADLSPYGGTAGANIGCQGGGCVVADDILGISNSGDNYLLGVPIGSAHWIRQASKTKQKHKKQGSENVPPVTYTQKPQKHSFSA